MFNDWCESHPLTLCVNLSREGGPAYLSRHRSTVPRNPYRVCPHDHHDVGWEGRGEAALSHPRAGQRGLVRRKWIRSGIDVEQRSLCALDEYLLASVIHVIDGGHSVTHVVQIRF